MASKLYDFRIPYVRNGYVKVLVPADSYEEAEKVLSADHDFVRREAVFTTDITDFRVDFDSAQIRHVFEMDEDGMCKCVY